MVFIMRKQSSKVPKKKISYKITNWREYNTTLKQQDSLTVWFVECLDKNWSVPSLGQQKRDHPLIYSQTFINVILTLHHLFKLALRQVICFVESLFSLLGKFLSVTEFSRLSKGADQYSYGLHLPSLNKTTHLVIDSTGLKSVC